MCFSCHHKVTANASCSAHQGLQAAPHLLLHDVEQSHLVLCKRLLLHSNTAGNQCLKHAGAPSAILGQWWCVNPTVPHCICVGSLTGSHHRASLKFCCKGPDGLQTRVLARVLSAHTAYLEDLCDADVHLLLEVLLLSNGGRQLSLRLDLVFGGELPGQLHVCAHIRTSGWWPYSACQHCGAVMRVPSRKGADAAKTG